MPSFLQFSYCVSSRKLHSTFGKGLQRSTGLKFFKIKMCPKKHTSSLDTKKRHKNAFQNNWDMFKETEAHNGLICGSQRRRGLSSNVSWCMNQILKNLLLFLKNTDNSIVFLLHPCLQKCKLYNI